MQFLRSYQRVLHGEPKYFATDPEAIGQPLLAPLKSEGDWKLEIYRAGGSKRPAFHPASLSLLQTAGAAVFDVECRPYFLFDMHYNHYYPTLSSSLMHTI